MTSTRSPSRGVAALVACLCGLVPGAARANDGYAEVGVGGLVSPAYTDEVWMAREVLEVSAHRIRVDYDFASASRRPVRVQVLFPLPLYGAQGGSITAAGAPPDFSVRVDGQARPFTTRVAARLGECEDHAQPTRRDCTVDVTPRLKALGLSDPQIAWFPASTPFVDAHGRPQAPTPPLTPAQRQALVKADLLMLDGPNPPEALPRWLADVSYLWQLDVPGDRPVHVSHEYAPFTGGGANAHGFDEDTLRNDYCADDAAIAAWHRLAAEPGRHPSYGEGSEVPGRRVEYILSTARSWAGGRVGDFTLRLRKGTPRELVLLCFPGTMRRLDPLTFEVHLHAFTPRAELRVLFLNVDEQDADGPLGVAPVLPR